MTTWIIYIMESGVTLMFFWMVYWLFLRNETFFKLNRLFLQLSLVLALIIPALDWFLTIQNTQNVPVILLDTIVVTAQHAENQTIAMVNKFQWITFVYVLGVAISLALLIYGIISIFWLIRKSTIIKNHHYVYVLHERFTKPFSFLNYIFIDSYTYCDKKYAHVLAHEQVHVRQKHSIDLIFSGLITVIQWFNPFAWLYRKAFSEIHEFLADREVLRKGVNPARYKHSLVYSTSGFLPGSLSFFNVSFTKRRFKMMSRMNSPKSKALKVLLLLPVVSLMFFVFACSSDQEQEIMVEQSNQDVKSDSIYTIVDQPPEYTGGMSALFEDVQNGIVFPDIVKEAGIQGKVFVSFVIGKNGSVKDVSIAKLTDLDGNTASFNQAIEDALKTASVEAVSKLNEWSPGEKGGVPVNVKYIIPIAFKLN